MKYKKDDAKDGNRNKNSRSITSKVTKGERLKEAKFITKHVEDTTSLALMSKRELYEKVINNKSKGNVTNKREKQKKGFGLYQQKRET